MIAGLLIIALSGFIFAGALFGFILARLQYLSIDGKFRVRSSPGEWYWLRNGHMRVGVTLHLATIIPAGFCSFSRYSLAPCTNVFCPMFNGA